MDEMTQMTRPCLIDAAAVGMLGRLPPLGAGGAAERCTAFGTDGSRGAAPYRRYRATSPPTSRGKSSLERDGCVGSGVVARTAKPQF